MVSSSINNKAVLCCLLPLLVGIASSFSPTCWSRTRRSAMSRRIASTAPPPQPQPQPLLQLSSSSADNVVMSDKLMEVIDRARDGVKEAGHEEEWNKAVAILMDAPVNIADPYEAEHYLAQATNWKSWAVTTSAIARKYISPKVPDSAKLQQNIDWVLNTDGPLKLGPDLLSQQAIPKAPVAYLVDPEATYQKALAAAPRQYQSEEAFSELIRKDPTALQNTYNCADTGCNSECGNCWVSYEMRL